MSNRIQKEGLQDGSPEETGKCPVCRLMYGHATFDFLCSRCYRQSQDVKKLQEFSIRINLQEEQGKIKESPAQPTIQKQSTKKAEPEVKIDKSDEQKETTKIIKEPKDTQDNFDFLKRPVTQQFKPQQVKCMQCQRKTKLLGYDCRHCLRHFCKDHRMPEKHSCEVDFFAISQQQKKAALKSSEKKKTKIADI